MFFEKLEECPRCGAADHRWHYDMQWCDCGYSFLHWPADSQSIEAPREMSRGDSKSKPSGKG